MTQTDTFTRPLVIALAAIILLPALAMVFMMPMVGMGMGAWGWGHMTDTGMWGAGGGPWIWVVIWFVPLLLVAAVGYLLYAGLRRSDDGSSDAAIEELRLAYARGDLSEEEFERRRERLDRSG